MNKMTDLEVKTAKVSECMAELSGVCSDISILLGSWDTLGSWGRRWMVPIVAGLADNARASVERDTIEQLDHRIKESKIIKEETARMVGHVERGEKIPFDEDGRVRETLDRMSESDRELWEPGYRKVVEENA